MRAVLLSSVILLASVAHAAQNVAESPVSRLVGDTHAADQTRAFVLSGERFELGPIAPLHTLGLRQSTPLPPEAAAYLRELLRTYWLPEFERVQSTILPREVAEPACAAAQPLVADAEITFNGQAGMTCGLLRSSEDDLRRTARNVCNLLAPEPADPACAASPPDTSGPPEEVLHETGVATFAPLFGAAAANNDDCEIAVAMSPEAARARATTFCRRDDALLSTLFFLVFDPAERVIPRYLQNGRFPQTFCFGWSDESSKECWDTESRGVHSLEDVTIAFQAQQFVECEEQDPYVCTDIYDWECPDPTQCGDRPPHYGFASDCNHFWCIVTPSGPSQDFCPQGDTCRATRDGIWGKWIPLPIENNTVLMSLMDRTGAAAPYPSILPVGIEIDGRGFSTDILGRLDLDDDPENIGDELRLTRHIDDRLDDMWIMENWLATRDIEDPTLEMESLITHAAEGSWASSATLRITPWPWSWHGGSIIGESAWGPRMSVPGGSLYVREEQFPLLLEFRNLPPEWEFEARAGWEPSIRWSTQPGALTIERNSAVNFTFDPALTWESHTVDENGAIASMNGLFWHLGGQWGEGNPSDWGTSIEVRANGGPWLPIK